MPRNYSRLLLLGLPVIENLEDLSEHVHLSKGLLYRLSKRNNLHYIKFEIPKKSGGKREIACPSRELKAVQAWILRDILDKTSVSNAATAFRSDRNILYNAECHKHDRFSNNRYFLCLDIDDFFPSISGTRIIGIFETLGYNSFISRVLALLCTCDDSLPQGGVTSPALCNIVCINLDRRILGYVGKKNIAYSRYADDMTFSCMNANRLIGVKKMVAGILKDEGFSLNESKTRFLGPKSQRRITGLVISNDRIGIGRGMKRLLRAKIHRLYTADMPDTSRQSLLLHIKGWLSFTEDVDKKTYDRLMQYISKFGSSERYLLPL